MKKIYTYIAAILMNLMLVVEANASSYAVVTNGRNAGTFDSFVGDLINRIMPIALTLCTLVVFLAVIKAGFDTIKHRKDADKRKEILHSFLWIAIGTFMIGAAVIIANLIFTTAVLK